MARRYLGMTPAEWDALAWWEQITYLEGYEEEGLIETSNVPHDPTVTSQEVHQSGGTTITEQQHETQFSMMPGEMSAFGLTETTLG